MSSSWLGAIQDDRQEDELSGILWDEGAFVGTTQAKAARAKLSTTVAQETLEFLEAKVASGEAATLAEAVDTSIRRVRQLENRHRLAVATARYFDELEPLAASEESSIAHDLASAATVIDFDHEL